MNKYTPRPAAAIMAHLRRKVEEQDWAAVSVAANDLCDMEILEARSMSGARAVGLTA